MCPGDGKVDGRVHGIRFRFSQAQPSVYGPYATGKAIDGLRTELVNAATK